MSEFDFEERIAQEKIRNTFLFKSDSWLIVEGIMERILKLTHWSCYINELDRKKPEHCIEQVIQGGLATCQMVFELKHDA